MTRIVLRPGAVWLLAMALVAQACTLGSGDESPSAGPDAGTPESPTAPPTPTDPQGPIRAEPVIPPCEPECWPSAFDFAPDGSLIYGEQRTGRIRIVDPTTGSDRRLARIGNVATTTYEMGLVGIAVHPDWPDPPWIYAFYTHSEPLENRLVRIRVEPDGSTRTRILLTLAAGDIHNGGSIRFGPDGYLYAATGEAGQPFRAQDVNDPGGKILRLDERGRPAPDNPFPGSPALSYGHRNSYGFAHDPETGHLWQTENGPECNDEINRIRPGRNYGWGPVFACPETNASGPDRVPPARLYPKTIAPSGMAFCEDCGLGRDVEGTLLFGNFNRGQIRQLVLNANRRRIAEENVLFRNEHGILSLRPDPDGILHFSDMEGIYRLTRAP